MNLLRDIGAAWRAGHRVWGDVFIATWELALANVRLRTTPSENLPLLDRAPDGRSRPALSENQQKLVDRVTYIVPIMGLRAPWRSDCLVQALAARRWLLRGGVISDLCLGVRKGEKGFEAHAWLRVGDRVVTGGEIDGYAELPSPDHSANTATQ